MGAVRAVTGGFQCAQLQTDGSPAASSLHRDIVHFLPLVYIATRTTLCPLLLLYEDPSTVLLPAELGLRVILVTWRPPSSGDTQKISNYFNGSTFLWISELNGNREKYLTFEDGSLREVNKTVAASVFKFKKLTKLPDYKRKIFRIATTNYSVYSQVAQPDKHGHFKWTRGIQLTYLMLLCRSVGLRPVVTRYIKWDSYYKNGSIKTRGLQYAATSGEVDASVGGIWYRANTGNWEVLHPWGRGCFRYLIPRPRRLNFDWSMFLGAFNPWVWVLIVVCVVVTPLLLNLATKLSQDPKHRKHHKTIGHTFFFVISVLVQMPQLRQKWKGAQIPIFYSWMLATMVLAAAFGGSLSAMLVIPTYEERPKTFRDLIDRGFTYGSPYSSSGFEAIFEDDQEQSDWKEWTYGRFRLTKTFEETVERMKTGKFLVSGEYINNIFFFLSSPIPPEGLLKKFEINGQCHQYYLTGPVLPSWSPYGAALALADSRMRSGGIGANVMKYYLRIDPALRKFIPEADLTPSREFKNPAIPLSLGSLSYSFTILAIGFLLASCSFVIELLIGYGLAI